MVKKLRLVGRKEAELTTMVGERNKVWVSSLKKEESNVVLLRRKYLLN
jgi:hypothetical protein